MAILPSSQLVRIIIWIFDTELNSIFGQSSIVDLSESTLLHEHGYQEDKLATKEDRKCWETMKIVS